MSESLMDELRGLTGPHLADGCLRLGLPIRCAPPALQALAPGMECRGRALPVRHVGSIDVVVLDLSMPRVDGVAATTRLKEHPQTRHIPVIVVTGFPHEAAQRRAIDAGADVFLTKPCLPDELEAAVRSLLGRRAAGA